jgi:predicted TIM-barrel fold metal-dependent hydrolase
VIDTLVHPFPRTSGALRDYMPQPWRERPFPEPHRYLFPAPTGDPPYGEWREDARPDGALPACEPAIVHRHLDAIGAERAILLPLTRGLLADVDMGNVICRATNDWLAASWLDDERFAGSIRVNPRDPAAAIAEVERWAGDPRMVQVAIPLEAHQPYGQRHYFPLWEAIAELGLPVAVRADGGSGADFHTTPNGYPHQFAEFAVLYPLNYMYHLSSQIAEGVFERLPDLRFVFTDGGHDVLIPLLWRMDMDWPISKIETPWLRRLPTDYLGAHVRFVTSRLEGPIDAAVAAAWVELSDATTLLLFGSRFPHWTGTAAASWGEGYDDAARRQVLADNATRFYPGLSAAPAGT